MKLRHIANVRNSNVDKIANVDETPVRLCNYVDVYKNDFITNDMPFMEGTATEKEIQSFRLRVGDVIITKDSEDHMDIGVPALVRSTANDLVCGYHLTMLRPDTRRILGEYLFWALQTHPVRDAFSNAAYGVTRYGLSLGAMKSIGVPVPDLDTQKTISGFLDREIARIDALVEKKVSLIPLLREKQRSAITLAVTSGIEPDVSLKGCDIPWITSIPEHWTVSKLGYLGRLSNGISIGGDAFGSGFPFVSYGDVYKNRSLPTSVSGLVLSSEKDRKSYDVRAGDVFFTRTSETVEEIGFASVCLETIEDAVFAGFLIRFRPRKNVLVPHFSKYAFQHDGLRHYFASKMNIITRASLSQDLLRNMPVPLPPIPEQIAIANHLQEIENKVEALIHRTERSIVLLKELRASLITAAVVGEIDPATYRRNGTTDRALDRIAEEMTQ